MLDDGAGSKCRLRVASCGGLKLPELESRFTEVQLRLVAQVAIGIRKEKPAECFGCLLVVCELEMRLADAEERVVVVGGCPELNAETLEQFQRRGVSGASEVGVGEHEPYVGNSRALRVGEQEVSELALREVVVAAIVQAARERVVVRLAAADGFLRAAHLRHHRRRQ